MTEQRKSNVKKCPYCIHNEELEYELEGDTDLRRFLGLSNDMPRDSTEIWVKFKVNADVENTEQRLLDCFHVIRKRDE